MNTFVLSVIESLGSFYFQAIFSVLTHLDIYRVNAGNFAKCGQQI